MGVTIRLGHCLYLLDVGSASGLLSAYQQLAHDPRALRLRDTNRGAHFLDREVTDTYCRLIAEENVYNYKTVCECYPEGEPVFPEPKILSLAHVQIAVRDASCISNIHCVRLPDNAQQYMATCTQRRLSMKLNKRNPTDPAVTARVLERLRNVSAEELEAMLRWRPEAIEETDRNGQLSNNSDSKCSPDTGSRY